MERQPIHILPREPPAAANVPPQLSTALELQWPEPNMADHRWSLHPSPAHLQACRLHDEDEMSICAGYLRRGGIRCNKRANSGLTGWMPTCRLHVGHSKAASRCRVLLPCGFECGRLCEWMPLSEQRCERHEEVEGPCYFLERLPIELRIRIYGYLLPGKVVLATSDELDEYGLPANICGTRSVYMAICGVNRQVHDEATGFLYGSSAFTILLEDMGIRMCKSSSTALPSILPGSKATHRLQDYQMQLMLLEQQNKRRLMMARQEQNAMISGPSNSTVVYQNGAAGSSSYIFTSPSSSATVPPSLCGASSSYFAERIPSKTATTYAPPPPGATWQAPLAARYFNLIQSFRVVISFVESSPQLRPRRQSQSFDDTSAQETLYMLSDQVHRIVSRLQTTERRIYRLEVTIRFEKLRDRNEDLAKIQLLLKPFRRLANVQVAALVCWDGVNEPRGSSFANWKEEIEPFVASWSTALKERTPSLVPASEWDGYWGLEKLLIRAADHCQGKNLDPGLRERLMQFTDLRHAARRAREDEDWDALRAVVATVTSVWWEFVEWEKMVQEQVAGEIEGLWEGFGRNLRVEDELMS